MGAQPALEIRVLGEVDIRLDGGPVLAPSLKALELLCYLVVHRDRSHTREVLAERLWPEGRAEVSKRYLRQALWRLNSSLRTGPELLAVESELIRLDSAAAWLDVEDFERAYPVVRETPAQALSEADVRALEHAVSLYRGDLLANVFFDWCGYERDRLRLLHLLMREHLMDYCCARGLYRDGLAHGEVVLRQEPARETTHRRLMLLHYSAGDRVSALRQYDHCREAMAREFGIQPSAGTDRLHEQIRGDRELAVAVSTTGPADGRPRIEVIAELSNRLDQIQASLTAVQQALNGALLHDLDAPTRDLEPSAAPDETVG